MDNWNNRSANVSNLVGKVVKDVHYDEENEAIFFLMEDGTKYIMHHSQDCCERVTVESIVGDLQDLTGTPMLVAEERCYTDREGQLHGTVPDHIWIMAYWAGQEDYYGPDSETWTFYTFRTIKGSVDIRWYGSSDGYYSESVDFDRICQESA